LKLVHYQDIKHWYESDIAEIQKQKNSEFFGVGIRIKKSESADH
jgi:hypothetical protein